LRLRFEVEAQNQGIDAYFEAEAEFHDSKRGDQV
jgi:hypothetical protein